MLHWPFFLRRNGSLRSMSTEAQESAQRLMNQHDKMTGGGGTHRIKLSKVGMLMGRPLMSMKRVGITLLRRFPAVFEAIPE